MARSVADVAFLLSVMAGADARDPLSYPSDPLEFTQPLERDLRGMRVAWCLDLAGCRSIGGSAPCWKSSASTFDDLGCIVEDACPDLGDVDEIFLTFRTWASWNTARPAAGGSP